VPAPNSVTPHLGSLPKFVLLPALLCAGIPVAAAVLSLQLEGWSQFILFVGGMAMVPALIFLAVRITDFRTGGVGQTEAVYTLRYSRGFYLREVTVPGANIVQVRLQQSFFQKRSGRCDVIVRTRSEGRVAHRIKGLPLACAEQAFA